MTVSLARPQISPKGNLHPIQRVKLWAVKNYLFKAQKSSYAPPKVVIPDVEIKNEEIPESVIRYLTTVGTWATSADNCQPWKLEWKAPYLFLNEDTNRTGFFYDVNHESTYITFGAMIENIKIAASHFGLETKMEHFPNGYESTTIARLSFKPSETEEDPLFPHVLNRHVNRKKYYKKIIPSCVVDQLRKTVRDFSGGHFFWFDDRSSRRAFRQILYDADRILFEDRRLHGGLFRWLNLDSPKLDGLNKDVLELQHFQKPIFPMLAKWSNQRILNYLGASRMAAANSVSLFDSASASCLIVMEERKKKSYINGGRLMERFWVLANSLDLSLQPMAGFIFLLNHFLHDGASQFIPRHRVLIKEMYDNINKLCAISEDFSPILFFRIGYADSPSAKSPRNKLTLLIQ